MNGQSPHMPPAYDLQRSVGPPMGAPSVDSSHTETSMEYSEPLDGDSYIAASSVTAGVYTYTDATDTVHEMHLALLYLLSNPEEFQKALTARPPRGATTLAEWNAEYEQDDATVYTDVSSIQTTPLPFVVFADDAEVVLPQAHTASQLFGMERIEGIELEAAAGVPALSQLFLRWLALMPGGDHLNIIDPPGLTVMRIAGGRYRVTAAHRVIWTWMNEFGMVMETDEPEAKLAVGDLVTMTIVDVFETDNNGKLLSYCPTFDNRAVRKTTQASETLRKGSAQIMSQLSFVAKSDAAAKVNKAAASFRRMSINAAKSMATSMKGKIDQQRAASPQRKDNVGVNEFEQALSQAEAATSAVNNNNNANASKVEEESLDASPTKTDRSQRTNQPVTHDDTAGEI